MKKIIGDKLFDYPKPVDLVRRIVHMSGENDALILDSFAGSGTTAEAVIAANRDDGGTRKFILIEIDEDIASNVTRKRVAHVIQSDEHFGFRFCTLGEPLFDADGNVGAAVTYPDLAAHVFFCDTGSPIPQRADGPLIGTFQGRAIYFLFAPGSMGFPSPKAGNVLTASVLDTLPLPEPGFNGPRVVHAEGCTVPDDRLAATGVTFRQVPYQIEGL